MSILAIFNLGSGICGGATSGGMLIAGRAIQGAGSGGLVLTVNIIVSDLCPLRKRSQYMAVILAIFGVGVALGPFVGGAVSGSFSLVSVSAVSGVNLSRLLKQQKFSSGKKEASS